MQAPGKKKKKSVFISFPILASQTRSQPEASELMLERWRLATLPQARRNGKILYLALPYCCFWSVQKSAKRPGDCPLLEDNLHKGWKPPSGKQGAVPSVNRAARKGAIPAGSSALVLLPPRSGLPKAYEKAHSQASPLAERAAQLLSHSSSQNLTDLPSHWSLENIVKKTIVL